MLLLTETLRAWNFLGLEEGLKAIREAGFDGVDFSFYGEAAREFCGPDYMEKAVLVKELLGKYGLTAPQAHAPFTFKNGMAWDDSCQEYLVIKRSIEAAAFLGVDHITVHGVGQKPYPPASYQNLDYNTRWYRQFEPLCRKYNIKIAIENLSESFSYPDLQAEILRRLDSPCFIALVDTGHAWVRGNLQPGEYIRQLPPGTCQALHVQDTHNAGKDEHMLPYMCDVDFDDLCAALAETDYAGDFSMEVVGYLRRYGLQGLIRPALCMAASVGRKLMGDIEEKRRALGKV